MLHFGLKKCELQNQLVIYKYLNWATCDKTEQNSQTWVAGSDNMSLPQSLALSLSLTLRRNSQSEP